MALLIDFTFLANLVVAGSAIAALLLNAYVAWGNSRDKKVELLGSIRGLVAELRIRHQYLKVNPRSSKDQMQVFLDASKDIANRIAKKVGRADSFIGESYEPAEKLAANLYELSELQLSESPTDAERNNFGELIKKALGQADVLQGFMNKDIEKRFKLHHVVVDTVTRILDP